MSTAQQQISISMDGTWAGSGRLVDGRIEDCGAQFCDDNDESLDVYEMIEESIAEGNDSFTAEFADGTFSRITWTIL